MGGAFGHMPHPFDLEKVKSGDDLINTFYEIQKKINTSVIHESFNIKIDGSNLSFKLVGEEFAVDRGTQKTIDVEGITISRISERYDPTYQVYGDIEKLLMILNAAYLDVLPELEVLGLTTENSIFLNTEFVSKQNVVDYPYDFIAIHGVSQFYEKYKKVRGGNYIKTRDGLSNPLGVNKAISKEIRYDETALMSLVNKLGKHAEKFNMKVFGPIPAEKNLECSIEKSLSKKLRIAVNEPTEYLKNVNGKTLKTWLESIHQLPAYYSIKNKRYNTMIETVQGKKINPYHKKTYYQVVEENIPVDSFVVKENIDDLSAGIAILQSTRVIGQAILDSLTSKVGHASNHEGIVIRDEDFSNSAFKITGEYIVKGMFGYIAKDLESRR